MESKIVPDWGFDIVTVNVQPMPRKFGLKTVAFPFTLSAAVLKARKEIKRFNPNAIISTGGFASGPSSIAARLLKIPLFLQEQNSYPGITQRYASKWAEKIFISFPGSEKYLKSNRNTLLMGNPVNIIDDDFDKKLFLEDMGLDIGKKTIFVTGGSQGAKSINAAVRGICDFSNRFNILWQTGTKNYKEISSSFAAKIPDNISLHHFIKGMHRFYRAADLIISRAGALSLAEIAAYGKPSILIPYPYAAADHQTKNAMAFEENNAAIMLTDSELSSEKLYSSIEAILENEERLDKMSKSAFELGKPNALQNICEEIIDSLEMRNGKN